ncbi:hypothetical protein HYV71_04960, partial [Candidatus Uhrbacteria bacterium]|nr:hypothetical protein [Candidatus Uhrbacteria bacterium]
MARRGEHTGGESAKTQGPSKDKADRKALAKQETAKRAALGAEAVKTPMPEAAPRPANPEHSQKAAPPESPIESVPAGVVAETPNAADTSAPAPAVASTADEERERAINAAFDHAKSSFEAAQQTGEGFRLKGTIATTIGTLKKRHGTEAVADLLQRLEREGVRDREEGASKPEESPKSEPTDIGSLENGIKEGEELPLLDLHYDQKKAKWVVVEKRTDAQGNESTHDAPSVYQDCVLEINDELGGDYLEDNAHRKTYVALLNQLKRELAGTRVSLITDRSGAGSVTAAYRDTERSEDIGTKKGSRISAQKTAVQHLRDSIVRDTAIPEIIENLGRGLTSEMNVYKSKARAAAWEHIKIGQGEGTIVVRGSVSFGGHTVELGDEHEYSIEFLARLAGKQPQALSGDEILAYAKAATLAALARDTRYAEAIKVLKTVQEDNPRPTDAAGTSRAVTPRGANRDADRQQPKPLVARTEGKVPAQVASKPPFEIGKTYTDIERLGFIDQEITKLNEEIRQLQKDGKKGSEDMANLARQQTALLLDKMDLQKKIAGLRKAATQGNTSAEEQAVEPPKPGPVPKPEAGAAATPSKPSSASAELSAEHGAALNDEQRKQLQKEYTDVQDNLVARRKKVADLEARGIRKKNEGTQLTYEKTQIARLEARRDALLKQLGFKTIEGTSREGGAEQPISEAERLALAEHMRIGLPLLARQGLRIIAEAVASARALTDKLQSYPENELGESRMEAIDNAIEIINTAEKERAEIAAFLDKTTDIAELRSLVGRSSEMALQSAAAAARLEAFAKEMRGQAPDKSAAKENAEQKLRAFYQEDPGGPHKSGLGIAFQKGEIIITHAVQGLGRGVLKKTTLSEADIRS